MELTCHPAGLERGKRDSKVTAYYKIIRIVRALSLVNSCV